jgi:hypothetical protein
MNVGLVPQLTWTGVHCLALALEQHATIKVPDARKRHVA